MATNQLSLNQIISYYAQIAANLKRVHSFGYGPLYDIAMDNAPMYPLMWVEPVNSTLRKDSLILKHKIYILDLVNKDLTNRQDVMSDSLRSCMEVKAFIFKDFFYDIFPSDESELEPYFEKFDDSVEGYSIQLDLQLDWLANVCNIPGLYPSGNTFSSGPNYININSTGFLPLTGGILTGPLSGTSADFTNYYSGGTPLETIINQFASSANTYTISSTLSGDTVFFDRNDQNNAYSFDISGATSIQNLQSIVYANNQLINGSISFLSGLTYSITPLNYLIGGQFYNIPTSSLVTVLSGDPVYDRIDTIYADISGNTGVITGTPSANPLQPTVDNTTEVQISFVSVPQGATSIAPTSTLVYDEFAGYPTEWLVDSWSIPFVNPSATTQSYTGIRSVQFSAATTGKLVEFSSSTVFDTSVQNTIQFAIKNTVAWPSSARLNVNMLSSSNIVLGATKQIYNGQYGFSSTNTSTWQVISIPVSAFGLPSSFIGKLRFTAVVTAPQKFNAYLDTIKFVQGLPVTTGQNVWLNIDPDSGSTIAATTATSTLVLSGGSNINTTSQGTNTIVWDLDQNITVNSISASTYLGLPSGGFSGWTGGSGTNSIVHNNGTNTSTKNNGLTIGFNNSNSGFNSSVLGGQLNNINAPISSYYSTENSTIAGGYRNLIFGDYSVNSIFIGGGASNSATTKGTFIGGGSQNLASAGYSSVVGGTQNIASGTRSFVGGGQLNSATTNSSFVGGGNLNLILSSYAAIVGGQSNKILPYNSGYAFIGAGYGNITDGYNSTIVAGKNNKTTGSYGFIGAGLSNLATTNSAVVGGYANSATSVYSSVVGGYGNINYSSGSIIGGGIRNLILNYSNGSFIGAGTRNSATTAYATVINGKQNLASGQYSIVGGGIFNKASGTQSFIGGGYKNSATTTYSSVVGGKYNLVYGAYSNFGVVVNGYNNASSYYYATVLNGALNKAIGQNSVILNGGRNKAYSQSSFIGNGSQNSATTNYYSTVVNGLKNRATGLYSFIGNGGIGPFSSASIPLNNSASAEMSSILNGSFNTASGKASSILAGTGHTVSGRNSAIIGGGSISATSDDTAYVPFLNIQSATSENLDSILVRNFSGEVRVASLSASTSGNTNLLIQDSSTGLIAFGGLSFAPSATTYNVGAIKAWFIDSYTDPTNPSKYYVEFPISSGNTLTNIASQNVTYIAIGSGGTITQQATPFTAPQQRSLIPLGVIVHSNRTFINAINNQPVVMMNVANQLSDVMEAIGTLNISGNVYSPNGVNLNINKTGGEMFKQGSNFVNDNKDPHTVATSGQTALTFRYRTQTGTETVDTTNINPDIYDVAGVPTAVPGNRFTIQHIALFQSNLTRIQYGQNLYVTMSDALEALSTETFVVEQNILENALQRSLLVVRGGTTDLTDTSRAIFIDLGKFGSTVGVGGLSVTSLQQAYNNSITPEITTDSTLGAVTIKNGTGINNSNQLEIQNSASTTTFFVTSQGNVSGNSLSANTIVVGQSNVGNANSAETVNLSLYDQYTYTLTGNTTFTFSNNGNGKNWTIGVKQSISNSGLTATFTATTASVKWQNSVTPVMSPNTGATDIFSFVQLNSIIYGSYIQNF